MFKKYLKPLFKKKQVTSLCSALIYIYLRFVYSTSKCEFVWSEDYTKEDFDKANNTIFALWHNRLLLGPRIFLRHKDNTSPLISSHSDGKIINDVVQRFGYQPIAGSTNKNSFLALKKIIRTLSIGHNIFINPDGPRGPMYKINSNITQIAKKYAKSLVPISCSASKYFTLNSWDKLIIPRPFCKIVVLIGNPIMLSDDHVENDNRLKESLMNLSQRSSLLHGALK